MLNTLANVLARAAYCMLLVVAGILFVSIFAPEAKRFVPYAIVGLPLFGMLAWIATALCGYSLAGEKYTVAWLAPGIAAMNYRRYSGEQFETRDIPVNRQSTEAI